VLVDYIFVLLLLNGAAREPLQRLDRAQPGGIAHRVHVCDVHNGLFSHVFRVRCFIRFRFCDRRGGTESMHRLSGWDIVRTCCIRMPIFVCGQHLLRQWPFILLICPWLQQLL
jgi:hypothetical protein